MKVMIVKDRNVLNTKFLAQFVNSLHRIGFEVTVVCDSYKKQGSGVTLDEGVKFINLNGKTKNPFFNLYRFLRGKLFRPVKRFAQVIAEERPDVIVCYFMVDLVNVLYKQTHDVPVIMMMHGYPPIMLGNLMRKKPYMRKIYRQVMDKAAAFHVLMKSYEPTIAEFCTPKRVVTIPNEVVQIPPEERTDLSVEKKKIIYVARIEKEGKRHHLLVEAFGELFKEFPDWHLEFWGMRKYPAYERELMELAAKYGAENNVHIKGYHPKIQEVYRQADIHAFPSAHEGFSLALADGMACGLPSIGFADAPSVNELIIEGHNGFLAKDKEDFTKKLRRLMQDQGLRQAFGKNAAKDMEAYAPEKVIELWRRLIVETVGEGK
ncbi:MAG: glycosyltransferase [Alphaproteobacteria bacterium]|nr:glycosyltransferase [Alphaproteobacteria bacterium]MBO4644554.1 glycosyltransferase [Alphaproteobacteria bacterium]